MSQPFALVLAIIIGIVCYFVAMMLLPRRYSQAGSEHLYAAMQRLEDQQKQDRAQQQSTRDIKKQVENSVFVRVFLAVPGALKIIPLIENAGLAEHLNRLVMGVFALLIALLLIGSNYSITAVLLAPFAAGLLVVAFLKLRIRKRRKRFLDLFPEALDIIVRSVKAGYPINQAIAMVGDSMPADIGQEYIRIINETSYGYTLSDAVGRFAERMDQPDINFFAVVVNVQQETGGNLGEVLGNLSNVIRQRKHMRLKIKALSSEGRMTVWILVGLACFVGVAVGYVAPDHFSPLFHTRGGHITLGVVGSMFVIAFLIIRKIINFRI